MKIRFFINLSFSTTNTTFFSNVICPLEHQNLAKDSHRDAILVGTKKGVYIWEPLALQGTKSTPKERTEIVFTLETDYMRPLCFQDLVK